MEKVVRHIGVFANGGDALGMNAATRAAVRTSPHMGIECVDIHRSYHGLTSGGFTRLTFEDVNDLSRRGGTMFYSARSEEFKTPVDQEKAVATCKMLGLDVLVGISGGGIFGGLLCLTERGLPVADVPGTIDNDVACSGYIIGYDAACNTALEPVDKLWDTIQSHEHCSVVEVVGHRAGHLTLTISVARSAAAVIVPERPVGYEADLLKLIRRARLVGRTHYIIIVVEGVEDGAYPIGKVIEETIALDTRVAVLGHAQRGDSPSSRDRITATCMGYEAVRLLAEGKTRRVVAPQEENYVDYDITEALQITKSLDQHTYEVMRVLTGVH